MGCHGHRIGALHGPHPYVRDVDGIPGFSGVAPHEPGQGALTRLQHQRTGRLVESGTGADATASLYDVDPLDGYLFLVQQFQERVAVECVVALAAVLQVQADHAQPHRGVAVVGGDADAGGRALARCGRCLGGGYRRHAGDLDAGHPGRSGGGSLQPDRAAHGRAGGDRAYGLAGVGHDLAGLGREVEEDRVSQRLGAVVGDLVRGRDSGAVGGEGIGVDDAQPVGAGGGHGGGKGHRGDQHAVHARGRDAGPGSRGAACREEQERGEHRKKGIGLGHHATSSGTRMPGHGGGHTSGHRRVTVTGPLGRRVGRDRQDVRTACGRLHQPGAARRFTRVFPPRDGATGSAP